MSQGQGAEHEIWLFSWIRQSLPLAQEQCLLALARAYSEARSLPPWPIHATVERGTKGKPYFAGAPWLHFSLTHSGDYLACAFSCQPLGLDLQIHVPCNQRGIARRFFHPAEADWLADRDIEEFYRLWAAKESYVKYTGEGIAGFSRFSLVAGAGLISHQAGAELKAVDFASGYSMYLCARRLGPIKKVRVEAFRQDGTVVWAEPEVNP